MQIYTYTDIHIQQVLIIKTINSGSLGCPIKSNIANAGILEINKNEICYKQLKIEYNVNEVIKEIERLRFPFYKGILKIFYGKE